MARSISKLLALFAIFLGSVQADQKPLSGNGCTHPSYKVHVFSKTPLVIYIPNFLTVEEREHLQEITYVEHFNQPAP